MGKEETSRCISSLGIFGIPLFIVVLAVLGCNGTDTVIDAELRQFSRQVEAIPAFNGATCLCCIDVTAIGGDANLKWAIQANSNPNTPQWSDAQAEAAILNEINTKIAQCPAGSSVKLQFMYHLDPKPLFEKAPDGKERQTYQWAQYKSVEAVLRQLATNPNSPIRKVYLTSCCSQSRPSTVNEAFKIPTVTHVITVDDVIELACGTIKGAKYPTFDPQPVNVIVWEKEGDKQIAKIPKKKIGKDEQFDINTNTVKKR